MSTARNHLIESLPRKDRVLFMKVCQPVTLDLARVLYERNKPTSYVYFPTEGFISLIAMTDGSPGVEVGMVGSEGMLGAHLALGVLITPLHAVVQGAGTAWRLNTSEFRNQLKSSPAFQQILNRYVYVLMAQLADSAVCLRFHQIGPRLARWLLMSQDRAQSNNFHVTQEFLAYMLGVRRVGITAAAGNLQRSGLIGYSRGELTVISRSGLEAAACNCYAADRKSYIELLG